MTRNARTGRGIGPFMSLSMATLLAHDPDVPSAARVALAAAQGGSAEDARVHLESAARVLYHEGGLDCEDARELVDLDPDECGCTG